LLDGVGGQSEGEAATTELLSSITPKTTPRLTLAIITIMQVTLDIPDDLAAQLTAAGKDPARAALEALAVEGYRIRQLSEEEVRRMLGYEIRMQVHALLKEHDVPLDYTIEDLEQDRETMRTFRKAETSTAA